MAYTTIDDPSAYFHTQLYTGNNSTTQTITNDANSGDFQADWLWIKNRDNVEQHHLMDSSRGANKFLHSNSNAVERTGSLNSGHNAINSFGSNGFTITSNGSADELNFGTRTYVAWQWKSQGGSTVSNTDGSITSTVQANTTSGFSIVQWVGDGSDATVGHGLSSAPTIFILKNRTDVSDWRIGQVLTSTNNMTDGNGYYMELNDVKASTNPGSATTWGSTPTAPTSSVFTVGSNNAHNGSSDNMVAYCFADIQGYSKFGSYTGNGSTDGPFIYTGFKPAWVMFKNTGAAEESVLYDTKRNSTNPNTKTIRVDSNIAEAEATTLDVDFLSNGFKIRSNQPQLNSSGVSYIYMAFAEHPFVSSEGVPVTAR